MILLAIDAAGTRLQLALAKADGSVDTLVEDMPKGHAERIFPAIAELLARNGAAYADLGRIAVTTGPGSFTGVRVGLSAARGLGLALGIPVVGVPTLEAISLASPPGRPTSVLLDARRGEAWFQRFSAPGVPAAGTELLPMETARARAGPAALEMPFPDIAALAGHAAGLDPGTHRPDPVYIREADAKPQDGARIARIVPA